MKFRKTLIVLATSLVLAACGNEAASNNPAPSTEPTQAPTASAPATNPAWQTITIGTEANFPPFRYLDEHKNVTGLHVDIIKAAAKAAELNTDFLITNEIKKLETFPNNPNYKAILGTFADNDENHKFAEFSQPILTSKYMIFLKQESGVQTGTADELKGKKIAMDQYAANNPVFRDLATRLTGSPNNLVVKPRYFLAWQTLSSNEADALFSDNLLFTHTYDQYKKDVKYGYKSIDVDVPNNATVLFQKGDTELMNKFNQGLAKIKENGEYEALQKKWFNEVKDVK